MPPPALAGPARTAVGSAAVMAGSPRVFPSAAAATTGIGGVCCTGAAAPPRLQPTVTDEDAVLHGWEDRRAPGGSSSLRPPNDEEEEPLTPELQLAVANELIYRFAMAQEKRMLSDAELDLVKFLLGKIPELEAVVGACGGHHPPRWGFAVAAPVQLAWLCRRSIGSQAAPPRSPSSSSEELLSPAEIAKEVISGLNSLVMFLGDRMPDLEAASEVCRRATPSPSKVALFGRGRAPAKASSAVAASLSPVSTLRRSWKVAKPAAAHVIVGQQVVTRRSGEEDALATSGVHNNISEANASHEYHRGQELSSEHECSPSSSSKEPLSPGLKLEVAKQVILGLTMAQQTRMLSAHEHSLIKFLEDRILELKAASVSTSGRAHEPAKASRVVAARSLITTILCRPEKVATPAATHVTVGPQFVNGHSLEEDANATSGVHKNNESEANVSGVCVGTTLSSIKVAPSGHACAPAKVSLAVSASLSPVATIRRPGKVATPAVEHVRVAPQVVTRRSAEEGAHATSGVHSNISKASVSHEHHRGQELSSEHESLSSSLSSSTEELPSPTLQLAIAKELINRFAMAQEKRTLSAGEISFIKFLEGRIPELEAASGACGGHHPPRRGFMVRTPLRFAWPCRITPRHCPSSSSKEPLTPALQLEIAKEVISRLTMAQERRLLSADELSLIKSLEDRIPRLEAQAALGVCSGGASSSKMAPSGRASVPAKAYAVAVSLSPVSTLHPLEQVPMPASAHVAVGPQVVTRHSGEEDAHATSVVVHNKMPHANASHGHNRGQELSSEHEYFSERCNSGCDLRMVTEKSSSTIAPEMAPGPSYGDYTAESSGVCVSNHWGITPEATDIDDFGLPDDLGIY